MALPFPRSLRDDDEFYRAINPDVHLKPNGTLSSAAFCNSTNTNELSVDWAELSTPAQTVGRFPNWPAGKCVASVTAETCSVHNQSIEYSPTRKNPAHSGIIGNKTASTRKKLARAANLLDP